MAVSTRTARAARPGSRGLSVQAANSSRRRAGLLVLLNLVAFSLAFVAAEAGFRAFSNPKYWIHTDQLLVGSGTTHAGKKWWPDTRFRVDSSEFHAVFLTNHAGYRARPGGPTSQDACRIAFVGDSFTEGMQVDAQSTFCARIERIWSQGAARGPDARDWVCENFGVAATDLLEYWHRIIHDVLRPDPPAAIVLCIYPGNDFLCVLPDDAFDRDDRPLREYFQNPPWTKHVIAWVNLHSQLGSFVQRAVFAIGASKGSYLSQGPREWWTDPEIAASAPTALAIRRTRAILSAIDDECRRYGTKLCILVVGPVANYKAIGNDSPLARILADWKLAIPVIDIAIEARSRSDWASLVFPSDGHLTVAGHEYVARAAAARLQVVLGGESIDFR
ncbi:MAG: hypothetical protein ACLQIB_07100 [Isosphaeraceae bacterium]